MVDYREDARWSVYIHIVPKAVSDYEYDKYYVGITSNKPENRWRKNGKGYSRGNNKKKYFWSAIQKYDWNNIEHEIVASNLSENEAKCLEMTLIKRLNSFGKNGYNLTNGGDGALGITPKTTKKIYLFDLSGRYIQQYESWREISKEFDSPEHIIKRAAKSHNQFYNYFLCYEDDIKKCKNNIIEIKNFPDSYNYKGIYAFDFEGNYIRSFDSIRETSRELNISEKAINNQTSKHKKPKPNIPYMFRTGKEVYFNNETFYIRNFSPIDVYIYKFDLNGNFIKRFNNANEVYIEDNIDEATLFNHLHKKITQYKQLKNPYIYRYYKDIKKNGDKYSINIEFTSPKKRIINHGISIYCFDKNTRKYIGKYISITEATKSTKITYNTIVDIAKKHRNTTPTAFLWRYKEDVKELEDGSFVIIR